MMRQIPGHEVVPSPDAILAELAEALATNSERVEPLLALCSDLLEHPTVRATLEAISRSDSPHHAFATLCYLDWPRRTR